MSRERPGFRELDHTADVAVRVWGDSLSALLANAGYAMFFLMSDQLAQVSLEAERSLALEAGDRETLLVDWLSELLFLHEMEGELYREFEVRASEELRLSARVRGGKPRAPLRRFIKAVTYHGLEVVPRDGGLETSIVFDI
ncbi:MAG: archease [Anaerolineae bacterium]